MNDTTLNKNIISAKMRFVKKELHNFQNRKELSFITLTFQENTKDTF
jgi:hypothetical protein